MSRKISTRRQKSFGISSYHSTTKIIDWKWVAYEKICFIFSILWLLLCRKAIGLRRELFPGIDLILLLSLLTGYLALWVKTPLGKERIHLVFFLLVMVPSIAVIINCLDSRGIYDKDFKCALNIKNLEQALEMYHQDFLKAVLPSQNQQARFEHSVRYHLSASTFQCPRNSARTSANDYQIV